MGSQRSPFKPWNTSNMSIKASKTQYIIEPTVLLIPGKIMTRRIYLNTTRRFRSRWSQICFSRQTRQQFCPIFISWSQHVTPKTSRKVNPCSWFRISWRTRQIKRFSQVPVFVKPYLDTPKEHLLPTTNSSTKFLPNKIQMKLFPEQLRN